MNIIHRRREERQQQDKSHERLAPHAKRGDSGGERAAVNGIALSLERRASCSEHVRVHLRASQVARLAARLRGVPSFPNTVSATGRLHIAVTSLPRAMSQIGPRWGRHRR